MDIQEIFAANMRRYRKAAHLTQEQLAEKCGLHRTYIGGIEQTRVNASMKNISKIADALEIDPALLFMKDAADGSPRNFIPITNDADKHSYALVEWANDGVNVRPIDVRHDDLTVQVLSSLISRGMTGEALLTAYRETCEELEHFLDLPVNRS